MRVLITGSRDWDDIETIAQTLSKLDWVDPGPHILVSGHCPTGADALCEEIATSMKWGIELHPADWETHGKRAGFVRNADMVNLGADICLAYIKNESKGATMTAELADKRGIPTLIYTN
jgi:hypothetical protein